MRIFLALAILIAVPGGLALYMEARQPGHSSRSAAFEPQAAEGRYTLEITATYAPQVDRFGLPAGDSGEAAVLLVFLNGREIVREGKPIEAGRTLRLQELPNLAAGLNEIYLAAAPPADAAASGGAVRLRLLEGGVPLADKTFWAAEGVPAAGTLRLDLGGSAGREGDGGGEQ
jgi:hypothetical protein